MKDKGKKIINIRVPFAAALSLAAGIAYCFLLVYLNVSGVYLLAALPVAIITFIVICAIYRKKQVVAACFIVIALFFVGVYYSYAMFTAYNNSSVACDEFYNISGIVEDMGQTNSGNNYLILKDANAGSTRLDGKLMVYLSENGEGEIKCGYKVSFNAVLDKYDLFAYGNLSSGVVDNIKYSCTVLNSFTSTYNFSLFAYIRSGIYAALYDNLSSETASVCYAMITGATYNISSGTLSSFRYGGIAHIFAVSGLHIGVLYAALTMLFKKLKLPHGISAFIRIALLFFYAGVCGFTPSSVRAAVMCSILAISKLIFQKYDGLNAMSVAAIILLLVNPMYLFDSGFILSMCAVLGIIFLSVNIKRLLFFLPDKIAEALTTTMSAQISTFPALLLTFGYVSACGLMLNLIILPILSTMYIIIFACCILCVMLPSLGGIMGVVCLPMEAVINFVADIGWENALISGIGGAWVIGVCIILMIAISDKFNFRRFVRVSLCSIAALSTACFSIIGCIVPYGGASIIVSAYYGGGIVIIKSPYGNALVVTQDYNTSRLGATLSGYSSEDISALVIVGEDWLDAYYGLDIAADDVYIYGGNFPITGEGMMNVHFVYEFTTCGTYFNFYDAESLNAQICGVNIGICSGESNPFGRLDMLISQSSQTASGVKNKIYFNSSGGDYNIYDCGDLQFYAESGRLIKISFNVSRE
jgi:ComEC/Rec2-related protein